MKHRQFLQSLAVISATLFCSTHLGAQVVKAGKKKAKSVRSSESLPTGLLCNQYTWNATANPRYGFGMRPPTASPHEIEIDSEKRGSWASLTSLPSACDFPIPFEERHNQPDLLQSRFYSGSRIELLRGCVHRSWPVARDFGTAGSGEHAHHDADRQSFSLVHDQTDLSLVGP